MKTLFTVLVRLRWWQIAILTVIVFALQFVPVFLLPKRDQARLLLCALSLISLIVTILIGRIWYRERAPDGSRFKATPVLSVAALCLLTAVSLGLYDAGTQDVEEWETCRRLAWLGGSSLPSKSDFLDLADKESAKNPALASYVDKVRFRVRALEEVEEACRKQVSGLREYAAKRGITLAEAKYEEIHGLPENSLVPRIPQPPAGANRILSPDNGAVRTGDPCDASTCTSPPCGWCVAADGAVFCGPDRLFFRLPCKGQLGCYSLAAQVVCDLGGNEEGSACPAWSDGSLKGCRADGRSMSVCSEGRIVVEDCPNGCVVSENRMTCLP